MIQSAASLQCILDVSEAIKCLPNPAIESLENNKIVARGYSSHVKLKIVYHSFEVKPLRKQPGTSSKSHTIKYWMVQAWVQQWAKEMKTSE